MGAGPIRYADCDGLQVAYQVVGDGPVDVLYVPGSVNHIEAMWDDFDAGLPPREMVISFSLPSAVDASLAPPGKHTASIWIFSAPATLRQGTWDDVREAVASSFFQ